MRLRLRFILLLFILSIATFTTGIKADEGIELDSVLTVVTETTSHVASRQEVVIAQRGAETNRSRVTVSAIDRG
jgi:hypothetical protein